MSSFKEPYNEEYEAQLYGYLPSDTIEGLVSIIQENFALGLEKFKSVLQRRRMDLQAAGKKTMTEDQINEGVFNLKKYTETKLEKYQADMEEYCQKLMRIPSNVLLPEDKVQANKISDEDISKLEQEVDSLKKQFKQEKLFEAMLMTEVAELKTVRRAQHDFYTKQFQPFLSKKKNDEEIIKKAELNEDLREFIANIDLIDVN